MKFALHLGTGTFGISEESHKFRIRSRIKSFGDIVHNGSGCALDLILQPEI